MQVISGGCEDWSVIKGDGVVLSFLHFKLEFKNVNVNTYEIERGGADYGQTLPKVFFLGLT